MKKRAFFYFLAIILTACATKDAITRFGAHYQKHKDYESLSKVVELLTPGADTAYVRRLLGEPIDMGFDFRYLLDSIGPDGCVVGAVFHIDEQGKIDDKWIDEICE